MHIKKDDTVKVIAGVDKNKTGKVLEVLPSEGKVIVEGVGMVTKHTKPRKQGEVGGLIKKEAAIDASKVMHICSKCKKPTRIGRKVLEDGKKVRICKHCNETFND
ncbi:MAG: 50S ribosomal protein L24 [Ruminococcaceae bacterium]|nr:50S ribosomal protein L24 [Oscillospiraceae bacterium]